MASPLEDSGVSRRAFVKLAAAGGIGLAFGVDQGGRAFAALAGAAPGDFAPNQWIRIDQRGAVTIRAHKSEMGQGVRTSLPAIVAAELGADWNKVKVVHAQPGPDFADMGTSGSDAVPDSWQMLRSAGATARAMLIAAAARRWRASAADCDASDGFVTHRPTKRRIGFGSLVADAATLPVPKDAPLRPVSELRPLGTRLKRVDTPNIVRGRATYGIDVRVPGMRYAAIARPPTKRATPRSVNDTAARAIPGVIDVVRIPQGTAVIATNTWAALRGRDALAVEWDGLDAGATSHAFMARLESAIPNGKMARREGGDVDAAMRAAATRLEATYANPFQAHAAMEPLNCTANVRGERCEIWCGTQRPNGVKSLAAKMLGIPEEKVTVNVTLMGGAFGRRIPIDYAEEAIALSRAISAPVQVVWSREDDLRHDFYNAAQMNRMSAAVDASGSITAWRHQCADFHLSAFGEYNPNENPADGVNPWGGFDTPYSFPALDVTYALVEAPVPTGAWRAVAYPAGVFARECFLDEVARATNQDPVALRLALIPSPGPYGRTSRPNGDRLRNVVQVVAERAGWNTALRATSDGRRRGRGIACNQYHRGTMAAQIAEVSVGSANDIRVERIVTAIDAGRVVDRSGLEAQVEGGVGWALSAALKTEVTFANGVAEQGNFNTFPVLRMREMPRQEIHIVESELGPFGAGEPPVPAAGAAVANAVFDATGQRLRRFPLRLEG